MNTARECYRWSWSRWLCNVKQLMGTMPTSRPKIELLNRVTGGGLSMSYTFTRTISIVSSRSVSIELSFSNFSDQPVNNLHISNKVLTVRSYFYRLWSGVLQQLLLSLINDYGRPYTYMWDLWVHAVIFHCWSFFIFLGRDLPGPSADRLRTLLHDPKWAMLYKLGPKILGCPPPRKRCKKIQNSTLIVNISEQDIDSRKTEFQSILFATCDGVISWNSGLQMAINWAGVWTQPQVCVHYAVHSNALVQTRYKFKLYVFCKCLAPVLSH